MSSDHASRSVVAILSIWTVTVCASVQTDAEWAAGQAATMGFLFTHVPGPSKNDAGASARIRILEGRVDANSGGLVRLNDGKIPVGPDDPAGNFFFAAGTKGGRLVLDLGRPVEVQQVRTYSWHPTTRGPQVYRLYAGSGGEFNPLPGQDTDPETCGWQWIADVDTRSNHRRDGGQYGVCLSNSDGSLGSFQILLFDVAPTEVGDAFGNTFYSEIDVMEANGPASVAADSPAFVIPSADGLCQILIETSLAPRLSDWAETTLAPVLAEWYPKIVALLPSEGFEAPRAFSVTFKPVNGVASTSGTRITANSNWIEHELDGEALGAIVHEVVHVVQQYGGRRRDRGGTRAPGFLSEGIPDYIRFFLYEPQNHGADILWLQSRPNVQLDHKAGYRVSANFLDYVAEHYGAETNVIAAMNAACRQGRYREELWSDITGKSLEDLSQEWVAATREQLAKTEP